MITLEDWVTSSGRFKNRADSPELTKAVIIYATLLLERVNKALKELGVGKVSLSSGFRPQSVNKKVGGAKLSGHTLGMALDIIDDKDHSLAKLFTRDVLIKFDLYREDTTYTKGKNSNWMHLDYTIRKNRIFKP